MVPSFPMRFGASVWDRLLPDSLEQTGLTWMFNFGPGFYPWCLSNLTTALDVNWLFNPLGNTGILFNCLTGTAFSCHVDG